MSGDPWRKPRDMHKPGIVAGLEQSGVGRYALCWLTLWLLSAFCSCFPQLALANCGAHPGGCSGLARGSIKLRISQRGATPELPREDPEVLYHIMRGLSSHDIVCVSFLPFQLFRCSPLRKTPPENDRTSWCNEFLQLSSYVLYKSYLSYIISA